jgi:hypothetical protein
MFILLLLFNCKAVLSIQNCSFSSVKYFVSTFCVFGVHMYTIVINWLRVLLALIVIYLFYQCTLVCIHPAMSSVFVFSFPLQVGEGGGGTVRP